MTVVFFVLVVVLIGSLRYCGVQKFNSDYISPRAMASWKGIFICLIFMSHFVGLECLQGEFGKPDALYLKINSYIGQLVVVLFLFLSGYGIMYSIRNKGGAAYIKYMPERRIFKTLLHFDVIIFLYLILQTLLGNRYSVKSILLALVGLESLGNSNWYIFAILFLYISSFISFWIAFKIKYITVEWQYLVGSVINLMFILTYILFFRRVLQWSTVWYDSVMCYSVGIFYCLLENPIKNYLQKNKWFYRVITSLIFLINVINMYYFHCIREYHYLIYFMLEAVLMIAFILLLSMKFELKNSFLSWCGNNLFYIYILQRIPFIILEHLNVHYRYIFLVISVIVTFVLTKLMSALFVRMDIRVFKKA